MRKQIYWPIPATCFIIISVLLAVVAGVFFRQPVWRSLGLIAAGSFIPATILTWTIAATNAKVLSRRQQTVVGIVYLIALVGMCWFFGKHFPWKFILFPGIIGFLGTFMVFVRAGCEEEPTTKPVTTPTRPDPPPTLPRPRRHRREGDPGPGGGDYAS